MNATFRQSMTWLHTWLGLAFGWVLFVIMLSGALAVFDRAITDWMQAPASAFWQDLTSGGAEQAAGAARRGTYGGWHFVRLHFTLHADMIGIWAVGLVTVGLLTALATGVIIHIWIFRDIFTFRPRQGARSWRDAHVVFATAMLPFLGMIAYSGLVLFYATYMPGPIKLRYGGDERAFRQELYNPAPEGASSDSVFVRRSLTSHPPLYQPTNGRAESAVASVRQTVVTLHLVGYGGSAVRWIYFLSGLGGAAAVAAGLQLYTAKRRRRLGEGEARRPFRVVERLNCAVVAGAPVAVAAYFWANRLLPTEIDGRSSLELNLFVAAWVACLVHAGLRPLRLAWREQFTAAAALCVALPLLNALTSQNALLATLGRGEWRQAGVDFVAIAAGVVFAVLAFSLRGTAASAGADQDGEAEPVAVGARAGAR